MENMGLFDLACMAFLFAGAGYLFGQAQMSRRWDEWNEKHGIET